MEGRGWGVWGGEVIGLGGVVRGSNSLKPAYLFQLFRGEISTPVGDASERTADAEGRKGIRQIAGCGGGEDAGGGG